MTYPDLYGAFDIARAYCGFSNFPNPKPKTTDIMWQHGVEYDFLAILPEQVIGADIPSDYSKNFSLERVN